MRCEGSGSSPRSGTSRCVTGHGWVARCPSCDNEVPTVGSGWLKVHDSDAPYVGLRRAGEAECKNCGVTVTKDSDEWGRGGRWVGDDGSSYCDDSTLTDPRQHTVEEEVVVSVRPEREPSFRVVYEIRYTESELTRTLAEREDWSEESVQRLGEFVWHVRPAVRTLKAALADQVHVEAMDPEVVEVRNVHVETMTWTPVEVEG